MRIYDLCFGLAALCMASATTFGSALLGSLDRIASFVVAFIGGQKPTFALDGNVGFVAPAAFFADPNVDRFEAGTSRRSAARNT